MFSHIKPLRRAFWIVLLLLALPAIAYAASYVLNSGEFVGLGAARGRLVFIANGATDCTDVPGDDCIGVRTAYVGIGTQAPRQKLHLTDGNMLIEGGGETALKIKLDQTFTGGPSGTSQFPIFELGRIIQAGDGDPEFRFLYSDDFTDERAVFEFDRKGIVASVKPDRGSHFEGFLSTTDPEPVFRLNSYPKMRLEMGNGGATPVDVAVQREMTGTLTFITGAAERVRIDASGNVGIGVANPTHKLDVAGGIHASGSIEVSGGYLKLDTSSGMPPGADCDDPAEIGRMKVDSAYAVVYVCTAMGWGKLNAVSSIVSLPLVEKNRAASTKR